MKNGVSKKLLWTEYMEDFRQTGEEAPLGDLYSSINLYVKMRCLPQRTGLRIICVVDGTSISAVCNVKANKVG